MSNRKPIAIHVEEVVIQTPAGPGLIAFGGHGDGVRFQADALLEAVNEAYAAIGVLRGIEEDGGVGKAGVRAQGCGALDEFAPVEVEMGGFGSPILPSGWPARGDWHVVLEVDAFGDVIGR